MDEEFINEQMRLMGEAFRKSSINIWPLYANRDISDRRQYTPPMDPDSQLWLWIKTKVKTFANFMIDHIPSKSIEY